MPLLISFSFMAELAPCSKDFAVLSPSMFFEVEKGLQREGGNVLSRVFRNGIEIENICVKINIKTSLCGGESNRHTSEALLRQSCQ